MFLEFKIQFFSSRICSFVRLYTWYDRVSIFFVFKFLLRLSSEFAAHKQHCKRHFLLTISASLQMAHSAVAKYSTALHICLWNSKIQATAPIINVSNVIATVRLRLFIRLPNDESNNDSTSSVCFSRLRMRGVFDIHFLPTWVLSHLATLSCVSITINFRMERERTLSCWALDIVRGSFLRDSKAVVNDFFTMSPAENFTNPMQIVQCSQTCGRGFRRRSVMCSGQTPDRRWKVLPSVKCKNIASQPAVDQLEEECQLAACHPSFNDDSAFHARWFTSEWRQVRTWILVRKLYWA